MLLIAGLACSFVLALWADHLETGALNGDACLEVVMLPRPRIAEQGERVVE